MSEPKEKPPGISPLTGAISFACFLCSSISLWGMVFFVDWKHFVAGYCAALLIYLGLLGPVLGVFAMFNYVLENRSLKGIAGVFVCLLLGLVISAAIPFYLPPP